MSMHLHFIVHLVVLEEMMVDVVLCGDYNFFAFEGILHRCLESCSMHCSEGMTDVKVFSCVQGCYCKYLFSTNIIFRPYFDSLPVPKLKMT